MPIHHRFIYAIACLCLLLTAPNPTAATDAPPLTRPATAPATQPIAPIGVLVLPDLHCPAACQIGQWVAQALSRVPQLRCPEAGLRLRLAAGTEPMPATANAAQLAKLGKRARCRFVVVIVGGWHVNLTRATCRLLDRSRERPVVESVRIDISAEGSVLVDGEAIAVALLKKLPISADVGEAFAGRRRETRIAKAWALYAEAERAWAAEDLPGALAGAVKATKLDRDFAVGYQLMGRVLLSQKRTVLAEAAFRKAGELDPTLAEAHHWLAVVLEQMGRLDDARTVCELAVKAHPRDPRHRNLLGRIQQARGAFAEALAAYDAAARLVPVDADSHIVRGQCLAKLNRLPEAIVAVKKAMLLAPKSVAAHNTLAGVFRQAGDLDTALETLDLSIQLDPNQNAAYFETASIYLHLQQWQRVIDVLKKITDEADRRPLGFVAQAYKMIGQARAARAEKDAAMVAYKRSLALRRDPIVQNLIDRLNEPEEP